MKEAAMQNEDKETISTTPHLRRELAKWAFAGAIIAALIGAIGSVTAAAVTIIPRLPPQEYNYSIKVSASAYPFANTQVTIEKGDDVQIIVQGVDAFWDCGKGPTSAEGMFGDRGTYYAVPSANLCELVGYIREGVFFRIGAYERFQSTDSGPLYLGVNDPPSYYQDNTGTLAIQVIVRRSTAK
jgi:hypothetical protein